MEFGLIMEFVLYQVTQVNSQLEKIIGEEKFGFQ